MMDSFFPANLSAADDCLSNMFNIYLSVDF
jgi:hypothetical protein